MCFCLGWDICQPYKCYSTQAVSFQACCQLASVPQFHKPPHSDICSSGIVQSGAEEEGRQFAPKQITRPSGNSFSSNQWLNMLSDFRNPSLLPRLPSQGAIKIPGLLDALALLGRRHRQREAHLAWIRQQRKKPLASGSNLSQPGFLRPNSRSCLVVVLLQHSHLDPHDPVIVLGMSAKLSDTSNYN